MRQSSKTHHLHKELAYRFILLLGIVSLFSDMVYEGARSITGPYLSLLGASGAIVGFVAGFGEALGYVLRIFSGRLVDKTAQYWLIAFVGYICNIVAIPLLALATNWQTAAALLIIERIGKAIRTPSRDAMLSYASQRVGRGWGFGIHQMLDQLGGTLGPLLVALLLLNADGYRFAFAILAIPGLLSFFTLVQARNFYPFPQHLEVEDNPQTTGRLSSLFWVYLIGAMFLAAGFADFPLIAFHFQKTGLLSPFLIPIYYMFAMAASAVSALWFGWIYDKYGCGILIIAILISTPFSLFVFLGNAYYALVGMLLWGVGMGAQRSLLKAVVGDMVPKSRRGYAFGLFNTGYGITWFLGSWAIGFLYDISIPELILFSIAMELCAIPFICYVQYKWQST